jgi:hypothetical protein
MKVYTTGMEKCGIVLKSNVFVLIGIAFTLKTVVFEK